MSSRSLSGDGETYAQGAGLRDGLTFLVGSGVTDPHIGAAVAPEHPAVLGMSLLEVDDKVGDVLAVPPLGLLERAQLDAKPRSGVGAEN